MRKIPWMKWLQSRLGRIIAGGLVGILVVVFANVTEPAFVFIGMVLGAAALFVLGEWR
jgi:hypothetical protein